MASTEILLTDCQPASTLFVEIPKIGLTREKMMSQIMQFKNAIGLGQTTATSPKAQPIIEENPDAFLENYDRITTILSRFSGVEKIAKEILEKAAIRGTKVHDALERWHKDNAEGQNLGNTEMDPEIALYVDSFAKWLPGKRVNTIERRFFCDDLKITGRIDLIADDEDGHVIYDYKTSASMHRHYELQLSAYAYLARKAGYNIKRQAIVFLKKDGRKAEEYFVEDRFDMFLSCLQVYRYFGMALE